MSSSNKEPTDEYLMVCDLMLKIHELDTDEQRRFVKEQFDNLCPYTPFKEQQIGLKNGESQLRWLNWLHAKYCKNEEAEW